MRLPATRMVPVIVSSSQGAVSTTTWLSWALPMSMVQWAPWENRIVPELWVKVAPAAMVRLPVRERVPVVEVSAPPALMVSELIVLLAPLLIVTACVFRIVTSSAEPGIVPPTHVPEVSQSPDAAELIAAASAGEDQRPETRAQRRTEEPKNRRKGRKGVRHFFSGDLCLTPGVGRALCVVIAFRQPFGVAPSPSALGEGDPFVRVLLT